MTGLRQQYEIEVEQPIAELEAKNQMLQAMLGARGSPGWVEYVERCRVELQALATSNLRLAQQNLTSEQVAQRSAYNAGKAAVLTRIVQEATVTETKIRQNEAEIERLRKRGHRMAVTAAGGAL